MYRKIFKVEKEEDLRIELPREYLRKEVEVIAFQVEEETGKVPEESMDFQEAVKFLDSIKADMSTFKFDRDDANQR